jgi:hypothetical protein
VTIGKVRELLKGKDDETTQNGEPADSKKAASKKTASTDGSPWDDEDNQERIPGEEG